MAMKPTEELAHHGTATVSKTKLLRDLSTTSSILQDEGKTAEEPKSQGILQLVWDLLQLSLPGGDAESLELRAEHPTVAEASGHCLQGLILRCYAKGPHHPLG
ncbi:MAG: hypothetical protein FRX49_06226 [Trebouxia sp. A1-2]|nr:MAG: hypothetical protein FRX49_06226 [Trebouxia sp. A1-2]